jgi:hypothetical protein
VFAILLQVGGFIYLWGGLNKQVEVNTAKWAVMEPSFYEMRQDISVIKEMSFGHKGVPLK